MKKFIQKTVAGVSALAMTAALSATAVPAFADEYEAVQEADFVQSYAVGDEQLVAEYLLDHGFSIDETTELMNLYQQGETNNEVVAYASNSEKRAYYSNYLIGTEHHIAIITTNAKMLRTHRLTCGQMLILLAILAVQVLRTLILDIMVWFLLLVPILWMMMIRLYMMILQFQT